MADENEDVEKIRPNIRIQIQNNLTEDPKMDVDNEENEDGEILESDEFIGENASTSLDLKDQVSFVKDVFTTGINIFDKQEQQKLQERARRFALKPEEIHNFTDEDLSELYESLGISPDNDSNVRFQAVHVLGIDGLLVEDLLEYFAHYAPAEIEWVDNSSCNVTWVETISAARALFYNSKSVRGMPAREPVDTFAREFLDDIEGESTGKSILLKNREIELKVDILQQNKPNLKNSVDIAEIKVAIPPGYWRLGKSHPKAKCLLMRFSLKTDKKPFKIDNLRKYYKKLGSKGLISENKKKELRGIFERNREFNNERNPWGPIAKNWDKDVKFREPERETDVVVETVSPSLQIRLGKKKEEVQDYSVPLGEGEEQEVNEEVDRPKVRMPRMRMYADEEEEKLKRKRFLQTIKSQTEKFVQRPNLDSTDLRNVLRLSNKVPEEIIEIDSGSDETDLAGRLKSRTKQMVFTVERDYENSYRKENRRRTSPSGYRKRISPPRWSPEGRNYRKRSRSPITRYKSPARRNALVDRSPRHHRKSYGTLRSDRMMSSYKRRRRDSDYSDDDGFNEHKPKSRVAVVVKKPKKPTVASTIWSRVHYESDSRSSRSESSDSDDSSSSSTKNSSEESESESDSESGSESNQSHSSSSHTKRKSRGLVRPGFQGSSLLQKVNHRTPLKVTMANDKIRR